MRISARFYLAGLAVFAAFSAAGAQTITITDTEQQSNFNGGIGAGETAAIAAHPFDFSGQPKLLSIDSITITLTVYDGDTGLGPNGIDETPYPPPGDDTLYGDDDFDVNSFSLMLDGVNLAQHLLLNGFDSKDPEEPPSQIDFITRTITGTPSDMNALLLALQDGFLSASIYDSTGYSRSNGIVIPGHDFGSSSPIFATLSLTGTAAPVPEPSSAALALGPVLAGAAYLCWRRRNGSVRKLAPVQLASNN